jgi:glutamate synthase (NADPH/NADH) large chain
MGDHGCEYMTGGIVVCLGSTGRNFAAGMSGGIAYVLDEDGQFEKRCNRQMVALENVDADNNDEALENLLEADESRLLHYITSHRNLTGSAIADIILADWDAYRSRFVRVMPHDYRDALEAMSVPAEPDLQYREVVHG